jgi:hypothetical protein
MTLDIATVATAIDVPVDGWPGNCNAIAIKLMESGLVDGAVNRYGHYYGPVSHRWFAWRDSPFQRHGWLEKPDGTIVDPTRWAFTGEEPYIYEGPNTPEYDWGGAGLRSAMQSAFPRECDPTELVHKNCKDERVELTPLFVQDVLPKDMFGDPVVEMDDPFDDDPPRGQTNTTLRTCQVFWIANCAPRDLGTDGKAIIRDLIKHGHGVKVPVDTRQWATGANRAV